MSKEFYKRWRPKTLSEVVGQESAIASIQKLIDKETIPHAIMLTGPSGTGKTTIARILRKHVKCDNTDYHEMDCTGIEKPLDFIRDMRRSIGRHPMAGPCSVWFLEEFQSLSRAGFSQQALLKILEDTPEHVYFILATTDGSKVHRAIHTRCYEVKLSEIKFPVLEKLVRKVMAGEKIQLSDDIVTEIVDASDGSARKALVILEQVGSLKDEEEQLRAIQTTTVNKSEAISLARLLISPRCSWVEVASVLKNLGDGEPEAIRYCVLGYARSCLLGAQGKAPNMKIAERAYMIIDIFSSNFYDSKHAGLAAACWEVLRS